VLGPVKRWMLRRLPPSWAGRLRAWRVRRLVAAFGPYVAEHNYGGRPFRVLIADPLSRGWYDHDWEELAEITLLRRGRLREGARVFDLGAHQGVVAMMLAAVVGPAGTVVAVEASGHNCAAARENRALNGLCRVEVVHAAVADRPGTLDFGAGLNGALDDGSGAGGRVRVPAVTVDSLAGRYGTPDVVFVDVEGAEELALSGAGRVLAAGADWFVEVHGGCGLERLGGSAAGVLAFFPPERFARLVRDARDDAAAFRPLPADERPPAGHFYLVAIAR
jgi:FkbM family methyltransferase